MAVAPATLICRFDSTTTPGREANQAPSSVGTVRRPTVLGLVGFATAIGSSTMTRPAKSGGLADLSKPTLPGSRPFTSLGVSNLHSVIGRQRRDHALPARVFGRCCGCGWCCGCGGALVVGGAVVVGGAQTTGSVPPLAFGRSVPCRKAERHVHRLRWRLGTGNGGDDASHGERSHCLAHCASSAKHRKFGYGSNRLRRIWNRRVSADRVEQRLPIRPAIMARLN